jgi:pimeloyl-ACP methyl ester carboxylesterase
MINEKVVDNNGVLIHYLDYNSRNNELIPLVIVPGLTESAEDYIEVMQLLDNRRCISISLRGRGKSDSPSKGYSLEDHAQDISSVISSLGIPSFDLFAYSRGVPYALYYALNNREKIKSLIIGDYPAVHTKLPVEWVDMFINMKMPWKGKTNTERMERFVYEAIQKESEEHVFWNRLNEFGCPVLVIRGGKKGAILSGEAAQFYTKNIKNCEVNVLEESDHNLMAPAVEGFTRLIERFINKS